MDGIWSLQYLAAGPICGCAGPLAEFTATGGGAAAAESSDAQQQQQQQQFTHGVLFRYGSEGAMAAFQRQPRVSLMLGGTGTPEAEGELCCTPGPRSRTHYITSFLIAPLVQTLVQAVPLPTLSAELVTVNFQGAVPSELEAVFRRGEEWEEGLELAAGLALAPGGNEADAAEFLSLAAQLATSSAYGAVQASWGPCLGVSGGGSGLQRPGWVLLVRFQEPEALQRFLACPPIAALLEVRAQGKRARWRCMRAPKWRRRDGGRDGIAILPGPAVQGSKLSPLRTLWHSALQIAPTEQTQQEQKGRGGLL